jgi:hypothetical protein
MPLSGVQTVDGKRRNRHETRTIAVFDASPAVVGTEWERTSIICILTAPEFDRKAK